MPVECNRRVLKSDADIRIAQKGVKIGNRTKGGENGRRAHQHRQVAPFFLWQQVFGFWRRPQQPNASASQKTSTIKIGIRNTRQNTPNLFKKATSPVYNTCNVFVWQRNHECSIILCRICGLGSSGRLLRKARTEMLWTPILSMICDGICLYTMILDRYNKSKLVAASLTYRTRSNLLK